MLKLPLEKDDSDDYKLQMDTVKDGFNNVTLERSGYASCNGHLLTKFKIAGREYDFDEKTWNEATQFVELEGSLGKPIYIVPLLHVSIICNKCDIIKMLSPKFLKRINKLKRNTDSLADDKLTKKQRAAKYKSVDMNAVNQIKSITTGMKVKPKFAALVRHNMSGKMNESGLL